MKDEYVSLIPAKDANNAIQWTMIHGSHIGQGGGYPDIDLSPGGGNYKIIYTIFDVNNLGIKFDPTVVNNNSQPKALNAIWISEGSGSEKKAGAYPEQISQVQLQKAASQLVVTDKNSDAVVLNYKLNFLDGANHTVTPIDPEIRNGGSSFYNYFDSGTVALLLGAAVLALTALLWVSHFNSRKVQNPAAGTKGP